MSEKPFPFLPLVLVRQGGAVLMVCARPHRVQEDLGDTAPLLNASSGNVTCTEVGSATCLKSSGFIIPTSDLGKNYDLLSNPKKK